jgi:hypothetical protein
MCCVLFHSIPCMLNAHFIPIHPVDPSTHCEIHSSTHCDFSIYIYQCRARLRCDRMMVVLNRLAREDKALLFAEPVTDRQAPGYSGAAAVFDD